MSLLQNTLNRVLTLTLLFLCLSGGIAVSAEEGGVTPGTAGRIAILPFHNLSGKGIPSQELRRIFREELVSRGVAIMADEELDKVLNAQRVRFTGGVSLPLASELAAHNVSAVLVTVVEVFEPGPNPVLGVTARLVRTGSEPDIFWIDGRGKTGTDTPGLLDLWVVRDPKKIQRMVFTQLADSLANRQDAGVHSLKGLFPWMYSPRITALDSDAIPKGGESVVVLPFVSDSPRRHAGEIVQLQMIRQLVWKGFKVLDVGILRDTMLKGRIIQLRTPSTYDVYYLLNILSVDFLIGGIVYEYEDSSNGVPRIDFSAQAMRRADRRTVWTATMRNKGDDGVFFFDMGSITTSTELAARMACSAVLNWMGH